MSELLDLAKIKKDLRELKDQFQNLYWTINKRSLTDADKIRGITVVTDDPTNGQGLVFDAALNRYKPKGVVLADGSAPITGDQVVQGDLRVGSGIVVGNAGANNPGPGEFWFQEQAGIPGSTSSVQKLYRHKEALWFSAESDAAPITPAHGWTRLAGPWTRYPTHTNMLPNPTFEVDTYSWNVIGVGSSIARQAGGAWGSYCMRVTMAGAGTTHLIVTTAGIPAVVNGTQYRIGFYAKSVSGNTALHAELWGGVGAANFTLTTSWQYFSFLATGSTTQQLYLWLAGAGTFDIDGMTCIQTTADPPYSDPMFGSGHAWSGTAHSSVSYRTCEVVTMAGAYSYLFSLGDKILVSDGGLTKFFYLICYWYDPYRNLTVLMLYGGTSYVLANSPTMLSFSKAASPTYFPEWMNWTPTFTGFSVAPTGVHWFRIQGKSCFIVIVETTGTANAVGFTLTLPLVMPSTTIFVPVRVMDNSLINPYPGMIQVPYGSLVASIYLRLDGTPCTAAGTKYVQTPVIEYPIF